MKNLKQWFACGLALMLIFTILGCTELQDTPPQTSETSAPTETTIPSEPTEETQPPAVTDVFDTSQDAGKLTARYLALTNTENTDGSYTNVGDCVVYTSPEGLIMMIDCSNKVCGGEIADQLERLGIDHIDIFVMSHPHVDHIGCFTEIAEKFPISQVYKNGHTYYSGTYKRAMNYIEDNNIPCEVLHTGDSFAFGEYVTVTVYGPDEGVAESLASDADTKPTNNASLALRITYCESSFWSSGDIYTGVEGELAQRFGAEIQSDVVKVNHHGYDTSNAQEFIDTLQPLYAIQMHELIPSRPAMERYEAAGATVFNGCLHGTVAISTTGDGTYTVLSEYE